MKFQLRIIGVSLPLGIFFLSMAAPNFGRPAEVGNGTNVLARIPELKTFIEVKEKQARKDSATAGENIPEQAWDFFKAARDGDWAKAAGIYSSSLSQRSDGGKVCQTAVGAPVLEVLLVMEQFAAPDTKYAEAFGRGIIKSIPSGSVYFGGTDPGRGLVTALSKSHVDGDPFYILTQNALADNTYMAYLRRMYGHKIFIPSKEDSEKVFQDYMADAQRRLEHDKKFPREPRQLKPGEDVKKVDGRIEVGGQVAVMAINAGLAKIIFDKNMDREFYIEESFPLDWMYPHLSPHGLIMKINREPLAKFSDDVIREDHEFWSGQVKKMLGDWLSYDSSVKELCTFVQKVYLDKDLQAFRGDPAYINDEAAQKRFSKLRSSIGGLYAWNYHNTKSPPDRARFNKEADFAFRQAYALCPYSPEALYRYVSLLVGEKKFDDALLLAEMTCKLDPTNTQCAGLREQLEKMKRGKTR